MNNKDFVAALATLRPSSTFLALKGYTNEFGEIADYSILFHMSYKSALERSILALENMKLTSELDKLARTELLISFHTSLAKDDVDEADTVYTRFADEDGNPIKGIRLHPATNILHLFGLIVHKKVLLPTTYPTVNSRPLTVAKNRLRCKVPVGKFRDFRITAGQVDRICVENLSLLPPENFSRQ